MATTVAAVARGAVRSEYAVPARRKRADLTRERLTSSTASLVTLAALACLPLFAWVWPYLLEDLRRTHPAPKSMILYALTLVLPAVGALMGALRARMRRYDVAIVWRHAAGGALAAMAVVACGIIAVMLLFANAMEHSTTQMGPG